MRNIISRNISIHAVSIRTPNYAYALSCKPRKPLQNLIQKHHFVQQLQHQYHQLTHVNIRTRTLYHSQTTELRYSTGDRGYMMSSTTTDAADTIHALPTAEEEAKLAELWQGAVNYLNFGNEGKFFIRAKRFTTGTALCRCCRCC
jgi:hypothetical protein